MDIVIRELCYKGTILQMNNRKMTIFIIIRFLINMQVQGHHSHQWAPFQVTG